MIVEHILSLMAIFALFLFFVIRMFIQHRLREVYIVTWIAVACSIPSIIIFYPILQKISKLLKISSPFNFIVCIGFIGVCLLLLHFSLINSTLQLRLKNSIQKLAILEAEILQMKRKYHQNDEGTQPINDAV